MNKVIQAQNDIARILKTLEEDTGMIVDGLCVDCIEVTAIEDDRQRFMNHVFITMRRLPGNDWACE